MDYNPREAFWRDVYQRYEKLLAKSPLLASAEATGRNLGLTREETAMLAVVLLGEANERFQEMLVSEARRRGTCIVVTEKPNG